MQKKVLDAELPGSRPCLDRTLVSLVSLVPRAGIQTRV